MFRAAYCSVILDIILSKPYIPRNKVQKLSYDFLQSGFNKTFCWLALLTDAFSSHSFKIMININEFYFKLQFFLLFKIKFTETKNQQLLVIKYVPRILHEGDFYTMKQLLYFSQISLLLWSVTVSSNSEINESDAILQCLMYCIFDIKKKNLAIISISHRSKNKQ